MKLLCFFLLSCSLLISCSNDEEMLEICNSELLPRFAGDGEYDVLGMGYDVTGEYLHPLSVKSPVLDINKYKQDHEGRLITGTPSFGYDKMVSGYNSTDYLKKITEESKVKINLRFGNAKDTMACFSQSITNTFTSEYSRSTKYSFASLDAIRNTKYIRINDEVSDISKYLSNEFTEDLKNLSADRIVERYGTHVLTDFVIGGRYKLIFRSVIAKQMDSSTKRKAVESSFELSLKKIGFSVNVENSTQIDESLTVENQAKELYILFYGGNGTNLKYDLEKGMPTGVDIQGWENSVKLGNVNLTQINWEETYPIYEFIQDPIKKQEIKMAVERHIEQAQLKTLELLPLYTYSGGDFAPSDISTTTTYIPDYALNKLEYIEGYVLKEQLEGTVPLYYYWTSYFNYTTTKDDISPYISKGIIGYVYASPYTADNLCPLYEYYKLEGIPPTKRYRTSTMSNIPEMDPIWHRDNHLSGYIYPNN